MDTESNIATSADHQHAFTDTSGRTWSLSLNAWLVARVRDELDINLVDLGDGKLIAQLMADPLFLADIVWQICEAQASPMGIDIQSFQSSLAGDSIEQAMVAMVDSIIAFTPNKGDRARMSMVVEKARKIMDDERIRIQESLDSGMLDQIASDSMLMDARDSEHTPGPVLVS